MAHSFGSADLEGRWFTANDCAYMVNPSQWLHVVHYIGVKQ